MWNVTSYQESQLVFKSAFHIRKISLSGFPPVPTSAWLSSWSWNGCHTGLGYRGRWTRPSSEERIPSRVLEWNLTVWGKFFFLRRLPVKLTILHWPTVCLIWNTWLPRVICWLAPTNQDYPYGWEEDLLILNWAVWGLGRGLKPWNSIEKETHTHTQQWYLLHKHLKAIK